MPGLTAASIATSPVLVPLKSGNWSRQQAKLSGNEPAKTSLQFQPLCGRKISAAGPSGLGLQLQSIDRRKRQSATVICAAALNAKCSMGQSQTVTKEAPTITITNAPANEKSPQLDDGGTGFPPRDDDGGGGGGGGGGGNWSGGFFLFGFLAFLGFLKDKESEEGYRSGGRRR